MTRRRTFRLKRRSLLRLPNRRAFFLLLLFCLPGRAASAQSLTRHRQDTVALFKYDYNQQPTNNGSACVYYLFNPSVANMAIAVSMGAPDSMRFDDASLFNGIHRLAPGQQLISIGDFQGKQVSTINLSPANHPITITLYCPQN